MALARAVRVVRLGASTRRVLTPCALTCFEVLVRYGAGPSLRSVCWCRCPFVFAFGSPLPADPTRPITSFKTAWIKVRQKAGVKGRWHDNRHTLVCWGGRASVSQMGPRCPPGAPLRPGFPCYRCPLLIALKHSESIEWERQTPGSTSSVTRQTRQLPSDGILSSPGTDHRSRPHQIAHSEMQHLSRASLQSA